MRCSKLSFKVLYLCFGVLAALVPYGTEAWGKEGHYATCKFAEPLLSIAARKAVKELLPYSDDLPSMCSWPDEIRKQLPWSASLHFINTPDVCKYSYKRDCHNSDGQKGMCASGAIKNFTTQLETFGTRASQQYNLTQALLFLSHIMGDIHQPLHVGFRSDLGGNTIHVLWYEKMSNLHHVWDDNIIETSMEDFYGNDTDIMIQTIQQNITGSWSKDVSKWKKCNKIACPDRYAKESIALACNWAYKDVKNETTLGDEYFFSRLPIIEKQLAKGGVRLAETLNRIFDSEDDLKLVSGVHKQEFSNSLE